MQKKIKISDMFQIHTPKKMEKEDEEMKDESGKKSDDK